MAEILTGGYQSIRDLVQSNWKFIELRDEAGAKIVRLSVDGTRVKWIHSENAQTLELQIIVKGSDSEITLPKTFASSAIYGVETGGEPYSIESFSSFTMEASGDELTVVHQLEIPQIV